MLDGGSEPQPQSATQSPCVLAPDHLMVSVLDHLYCDQWQYSQPRNPPSILTGFLPRDPEEVQTEIILAVCFKRSSSQSHPTNQGLKRISPETREHTHRLESLGVCLPTEVFTIANITHLTWIQSLSIVIPEAIP